MGCSSETSMKSGQNSTTEKSVEHCFRLTNQLFLCGPVFLKNSQRIVSLILLIMVGCLVAGLIERQIRRALAERHEPIHGLMPEGRDTLKPTVARILRAFADYSLVLIKWADGHLLQRQFARPNPVQQQILNVLEMPHPEALFGEPLPWAIPSGASCVDGGLKMAGLRR